MKLLVAGALAGLIVLSPAAGAKSLAKLPANLDPAKAYALVEGGNIDDAKIKGALTLARYDSATNDIAVLEKTKPTLAHETIGKPLVKDDKRRLYLLELSPGQWVIEGANGTAFSLGSRTFELSAGTLTDLGVATVTTDYAEGETPYKLTAGKALKLGLFGAFAGGNALPQPIPKAVAFRVRTASDLALPNFANSEAKPVAWGSEVKFGNYLGGLVNRMGGRKDRPRAAGTGQAETSAAQR
jgi:hypothetical protein